MTNAAKKEMKFRNAYVQLLLEAGNLSGLPTLFFGRVGGFLWDKANHRIPIMTAVSLGQRTGKDKHPPHIVFFGDERSHQAGEGIRRNWIDPSSSSVVHRCLMALAEVETLPMHEAQNDLSIEEFRRWWGEGDTRQIVRGIAWRITGGCVDWTLSVVLPQGRKLTAGVLAGCAYRASMIVGSIIAEFPRMAAVEPNISDSDVRQIAGVIATRICWRMTNESSDPFWHVDKDGVLVEGGNLDIWRPTWDRWYTDLSGFNDGWVNPEDRDSSPFGARMEGLMVGDMIDIPLGDATGSVMLG